jgi:hypothetical protein
LPVWGRVAAIGPSKRTTPTSLPFARRSVKITAFHASERSAPEVALAKSGRHSLRSIRAARRRVSGQHPVLEVGNARCLDRPDLLELHLGGPEVVEEASAVAEQYWNDVELELVQ